MTRIIGLCGFSRAGKDLAARLLAERFSIVTLAFADKLKQELAGAWGLDSRELFDCGDLKDVSLRQLALKNCRDDEFRAEHWHLASLPSLKPRTVMQAWGDWQNKRDPGRYVRAVASLMREAINARPAAVLITDVRLPHEYDWLRSIGGRLWRIVNPRQVHPPSGHATEHTQMRWPVDAEIVNDGSSEQLAKIVTDLFLDATVSAPEVRG